MEQETILYYYPMPQQAAEMNKRYAAKRHWFQDAVLKTEMAANQEEFCILGCAIPPFYYRRKPWKPQILSETMETVLGDAAGMMDTYAHPQIRRILTEEYCARWMPREGTIQLLVKNLLAQYAAEALERCGTVSVLLGKSDDTDRQMEMTWELLQPYLPRVNRMLIYYERRESRQDTGERGNFEQEESPEENRLDELQEYLETYYYEYGLVPQLEPYRVSRMTGKTMEKEQSYPAGEGEKCREDGMARAQNDSLTEAAPKLCCGKEKCRGVILDFCDQFRYPKIPAESSVYIDIVSSEEKERRFRQKSLSAPYVSPLKYLDTMVKNSYDRKVKMT